MSKIVTRILAALLLSFSLFSAPVWAQSLDEAKAQGLVGEKANGYIGIVTASPTPSLKSLVADINRKRQAAYSKSAKSAGVAIEVFELRMGQRLQQRTPAGEYIQRDDGRWQRK